MPLAAMGITTLVAICGRPHGSMYGIILIVYAICQVIYITVCVCEILKEHAHIHKQFGKIVISVFSSSLWYYVIFSARTLLTVANKVCVLHKALFT